MWAGSGHWSAVGTLNVMHSGVALCLTLVGWLTLVGKWGPQALGVSVCICGGGAFVLVCLCGLVGTGVSWQSWRSDLLGLTDAYRILPNFLLPPFFIVSYSVFLYISCNIAEFCKKLN